MLISNIFTKKLVYGTPYIYYLSAASFGFSGHSQGDYFRILIEGTPYLTTALNILNIYRCVN
jgi:hypothetical protein